VKRIAVTSKDEHYLQKFLDNAGKSLEGFRYFSKRPFSVLDNHVSTLLYIENEMPVCYGHLDRDGEKVWLGIAVIESHIGKGLGNQMMMDLINEARRKNIFDIFLTVDTNNTNAIGLYEKMGFKKVIQKGTYIEYRLEVA
jgi:GNAT superfamily N-acetyltransferase